MMMSWRKPDRRTLLLAAAATAFAAPLRADARPEIVVHRDPSCGCCEKWTDHLRASGYSARVVDVAELNRLKAKLGVPVSLRSCHTATVGGYVIEGHVPAMAIDRLLAEKPAVRGLAVPGMPIGSPGMEVAGKPSETYDVMAFGEGEPAAFMRFSGNKVV